MTEYFGGRLHSVTDELALAGSPVSNLDFITHLISELGQPYYHVVVYIEANMMKMSVNEAYSMLLTHEARIATNQLNASKEATMNYAVNFAQTEPHKKKSGGQANYSQNNQNNWNKNANWTGNNSGRGGFGQGFSGQGRGNWNNTG